MEKLAVDNEASYLPSAGADAGSSVVPLMLSTTLANQYPALLTLVNNMQTTASAQGQAGIAAANQIVSMINASLDGNTNTSAFANYGDSPLNSRVAPVRRLRGWGTSQFLDRQDIA